MEGLEPRVLYAVYTVTTTADDGPGSLRQAILDANAASSTDEVRFNIPGAGVQTISPASPLPEVQGGTTIDGRTQPGYAGTPLIQLDGSAAAATADGLRLVGGSGESAVHGLAINRFGNNGVVVGGLNHRVEANYVGVDPSGTVARPNGGAGVLVTGQQATIGGTSAASCNVISGNAGTGVRVSGFSARIQGNYIGTDAAGTGDLGNGGDGVFLASATGPVVSGNLISGNAGDGIHGEGGATGSSYGNYIGTDVTGTAALGNAGDGVDLFNVHGRVGLSFSSQPPVLDLGSAPGNLISGNGGHGVRLGQTGAGVAAVIVASNYIGTDKTGGARLGNAGSGVYITNPGFTVGGWTHEGNLISANGGDGVTIVESRGNALVRHTVQGNRIGTDAAGGGPGMGNVGHGVAILNSSNTLLGSPASQPHHQTFTNTVAYNGGSGVYVTGDLAERNRVSLNRIFSNGGAEIDLGGDGVTPNDAGDADAGPNRLLNFPVITGATAVPGTTLPARSFVRFTLNADANTRYQVQLFSAPLPDATGQGGASRYLGWAEVTTDAAGNAAGAASVDALAAGESVSALAIDPVGNTSEFSRAARAELAGVVGRFVFYNRSAHDGYDAAADARDDGAVAPDKYAAAGPTASSLSQSVTNYSRGINGIMIDVAVVPAGAALSADDFDFSAGSGDAALNWGAAPPPEITLRRAAGIGGADRVTLVWPEAAAVKNAWLRVAVKATADTGLASPDVFYFGNLVGDVNGSLAVDAADVAAVRRHAGRPVTATTRRYDLNEDRRIDVIDYALVRWAQGNRLATLSEPPAATSPGVASEAVAAPVRTGPQRRRDDAGATSLLTTGGGS